MCTGEWPSLQLNVLVWILKAKNPKITIKVATVFVPDFHLYIMTKAAEEKKRAKMLVSLGLELGLGLGLGSSDLPSSCKFSRAV